MNQFLSVGSPSLGGKISHVLAVRGGSILFNYLDLLIFFSDKFFPVVLVTGKKM
jgi:hypothetical protein